MKPPRLLFHFAQAFGGFGPWSSSARTRKRNTAHDGIHHATPRDWPKTESNQEGVCGERDLFIRHEAAGWVLSILPAGVSRSDFVDPMTSWGWIKISEGLAPARKQNCFVPGPRVHPRSDPANRDQNTSQSSLARLQQGLYLTL